MAGAPPSGVYVTLAFTLPEPREPVRNPGLSLIVNSTEPAAATVLLASMTLVAEEDQRSGTWNLHREDRRPGPPLVVDPRRS